jgi:hypothetical protein
MDAYLQPEETDPSPASSGEKAVAQKQPPAPPEPVTVFLESEGNSFARVSSQSTGQVVFEGRLRPNTYVGVTGVPPLLLEATDYGPFLVELPGRERVEPVPGRDFGVLRVAAATDLTAPAPDAGLGAPPPVYRGERQITPGSPGEGTALGTEATGEAGQPLPFFQRERVRPAQEETSTGGGESPSAPTGPPADEKARSEAAASPGEAPAPEADESGVKPEPGPSAEPSEDPSTGPRAKQPTD